MLVSVTIYDEYAFISASLLERVDFLMFICLLRSIQDGRITSVMRGGQVFLCTYEWQSRGHMHQHIILFPHQTSEADAHIDNEDENDAATNELYALLD